MRPSELAPELVGRLERWSAPDTLVGPLRTVAGWCRRLPGGRSVLEGAPIGHPVHPFLVTAPIGAWTSAAVFDLAGSAPDAARTLVGAGVVMALPTAVTGLDDWLDTEGAEQGVGAVHALTMATTTLLYAWSWWLRRRDRRSGVVVGLIAAGVASAGGWLGGHLVYGMGVGVDANAFQTGPSDWAPLEVDGTLAEGRASSASAGGVRLVGTEVDGRPAVLADRCSHRGGPLSEGDVVGGCFTCPWHGSRFDARTGAVREGPASVPQPVYEARRLAEVVEVRRDERRALRTNPV